MAAYKEALPFIVGSLVTSYPDEYFVEGLEVLLNDAEIHTRCGVHDTELWPSLFKRLSQIVGDQQAVTELRSLYIDVFDRGRAENSVYETEYGKDRPLVKGNELADIAGFYKAFGFTLSRDDEEISEMLDHLAVELEFYALLVMKEAALAAEGNNEGVEIVHDARKAFLCDHLGRFVGAIVERPGIQNNEVFKEIFTWCRDLINEECERLDVSPLPADWMRALKEDDEMSCGGMEGILSGNKRFPIMQS